MSIFFEKLTIENYKCFKRQEIELNVPDEEEPGSGLTVLIGNNGAGKTSILEAIEYLTLNSFFVQNKLDINDFHAYEKQIKIEAITNKDFNRKDKSDAVDSIEKQLYGIQFTAKPRSNKQSNISFSDPFSVNSRFIGHHKEFLNDYEREGEKIEILFFKNDRAKEVSNTGYRTAFQKITDELNWRFLKSIKTNSKDQQSQKTNTIKDTDEGDNDKSRLETLRKELEKLFPDKKDDIHEFFSKLEEYLKKSQQLLQQQTFSNSPEKAAKRKKNRKTAEEKEEEYKLCIKLFNNIIACKGNGELQELIGDDPQEESKDRLQKKIKILECGLEFMRILQSEYYSECTEFLHTLMSEDKNLNPLKSAFEKLKEYFPNNKEIENIRISPFNLLHPFSNASIVSQTEESLSQINISNLGSGIQMMMALLILKYITEAPRTTKKNKKSDTNEGEKDGEIKKTNFIYLIDEPELHLHPEAQNALMDLLLEESRTKQIVISTHSIELISRIFQPIRSTDKTQKQNNKSGDTEDNAQSQEQNSKSEGTETKSQIPVKFYLCKRGDNGEIKITQPLPKSSDYPYPLSRGAIAFHAFGIPTTDFHNELYGYLEESHKREKVDNNKMTEKEWRDMTKKELRKIIWGKLESSQQEEQNKPSHEMEENKITMEEWKIKFEKEFDKMIEKELISLECSHTQEEPDSKELWKMIEEECKKMVGKNKGNTFDDALREYFDSENVEMIMKEWKKTNNSTQKVTIFTYIRHSIHHPENKKNDPYTGDELKSSIELLIEIMKIKSSKNKDEKIRITKDENQDKLIIVKEA